MSPTTPGLLTFSQGLFAWYLSLLVGCVLHTSPSFETTNKAPEQARRPDGVAVDLEGEFPPPMSKSPTERGLVLLKEPVDISEAMQVVRTFFRAVADEDMDMMRSVLANEAQALPIGNGDPKEAERFWERRFSKFDYTALGGEPMYRESMVETYRYEDLEEPLAGRPQRPATMKSNDVLIRVYVTHTRIGINRVLGSEIFFVLRRTERKFEVQALHEDFTAP